MPCDQITAEVLYSIAYSRYDWVRGTGLVSVETVKSQCDFFTLNSHRLSSDYDVKFFSIQITTYMYRLKYQRYPWMSLWCKAYLQFFCHDINDRYYDCNYDIKY